jgi:putative ABC transport system permease protein
MFRRKRKASDYSAEIEAHIELETEALREQGLSQEEAHAAARRAFGNVTRAQERFYESSHWRWMDHLARDIRYGLRMLRHSPGFTVVAVLTIALGVGATTAIFSIVDATLLHPLPYANPEQLVRIHDDLPGVGSLNVGMSTREWWDLERSGVFESVSPEWYDDNNLTGSSEPSRVRLLIVATDYFAVLGVKPQLGRTFNPEDRTPGFNLECVISDGLWKRAFAADPHILGRNLRLDNDAYQIVGVMPPGFDGPERNTTERNVEVWVAWGFAGSGFADQRSNHFPGAIARLKPGLSLADAQNKVDALVASLQKQFPKDYPLQSAWKVRLVPLKESLVGNVRQSLIVLLASVGLVLLIGCVNVANLLLAHASARGREMAIRQALGAARARLARQLLTESLLLSLLGGIAGLVILLLSKGLLARLVPNSLPRFNEITISWSVLLFALAASVVSGVIFGLTPALQAGRLNLAPVLKQAARGLTGIGQQARTRRVMVITEFALSLVLMIAASLLLRSFWDLLNVRLGFNPQNVMVIRTRLPYPNDPKTDIYHTVAQQAPFFREVLRRVRPLPGVEEVALGDSPSVPMDHRQRDLTLFPLIFEGRETQKDQTPFVNGSLVTPEYFHLMGMTLLRGRFFSNDDNDKSSKVAVINQAMAQTYWPNEDPVGKHVKLASFNSRPSESSWTTIIGIVADAQTESLEEATAPQLYASLYQRDEKHLAIFLRGSLDTAAIPEEVRKQVQSIDPELPVFGAETLDDALSASLAVRRFSMEIIALFALTALLLAALGIYGVVSYIVSERTHEIGIRLALGARKSTILRAVLRLGLSLAGTGAAVGLAGALILSHLMAGLLYGVKPTDPLTFLGVAILLMTVAMLACYLPARRAIRVEPIVALRYE